MDTPFGFGGLGSLFGFSVSSDDPFNSATYPQASSSGMELAPLYNSSGDYSSGRVAELMRRYDSGYSGHEDDFEENEESFVNNDENGAHIGARVTRTRQTSFGTESCGVGLQMSIAHNDMSVRTTSTSTVTGIDGRRRGMLMMSMSSTGPFGRFGGGYFGSMGGMFSPFGGLMSPFGGMLSLGQEPFTHGLLYQGRFQPSGNTEYEGSRLADVYTGPVIEEIVEEKKNTEKTMRRKINKNALDPSLGLGLLPNTEDLDEDEKYLNSTPVESLPLTSSFDSRSSQVLSKIPPQFGDQVVLGVPGERSLLTLDDNGNNEYREDRHPDRDELFDRYILSPNVCGNQSAIDDGEFKIEKQNDVLNEDGNVSFNLPHERTFSSFDRQDIMMRSGAMSSSSNHSTSMPLSDPDLRPKKSEFEHEKRNTLEEIVRSNIPLQDDTPSVDPERLTHMVDKVTPKNVDENADPEEISIQPSFTIEGQGLLNTKMEDTMPQLVKENSNPVEMLRTVKRKYTKQKFNDIQLGFDSRSPLKHSQKISSSLDQTPNPVNFDLPLKRHPDKTTRLATVTDGDKGDKEDVNFPQKHGKGSSGEWKHFIRDASNIPKDLIDQDNESNSQILSIRLVQESEHSDIESVYSGKISADPLKQPEHADKSFELQPVNLTDSKIDSPHLNTDAFGVDKESAGQNTYSVEPDFREALKKSFSSSYPLLGSKDTHSATEQLGNKNDQLIDDLEELPANPHNNNEISNSSVKINELCGSEKDQEIGTKIARDESNGHNEMSFRFDFINNPSLLGRSISEVSKPEKVKASHYNDTDILPHAPAEEGIHENEESRKDTESIHKSSTEDRNESDNLQNTTVTEQISAAFNEDQEKERKQENIHETKQASDNNKINDNFSFTVCKGMKFPHSNNSKVSHRAEATETFRVNHFSTSESVSDCFNNNRNKRTLHRTPSWEAELSSVQYPGRKKEDPDPSSISSTNDTKINERTEAKSLIADIDKSPGDDIAEDSDLKLRRRLLKNDHILTSKVNHFQPNEFSNATKHREIGLKNGSEESKLNWEYPGQRENLYHAASGDHKHTDIDDDPFDHPEWHHLKEYGTGLDSSASKAQEKKKAINKNARATGERHYGSMSRQSSSGSDKTSASLSTGVSETPARRKYMTASQDLSILVESIGLTLKDVYPDGNCLFTAIADQLRIRGDFSYTSRDLRHAAVDYLESHPTQEDGTPLSSFLAENESDWQSYLKNMRLDGHWGDHLTIMALANVLNQKIIIHREGTELYQTVVAPHVVSAVEEYKTDPELADSGKNTATEPKSEANEMHIGHVSESHYVSLRPKDWQEKLMTNLRKKGCSAIIGRNPESKILDTKPLHSDVPPVHFDFAIKYVLLSDIIYRPYGQKRAADSRDKLDKTCTLEIYTIADDCMLAYNLGASFGSTDMSAKLSRTVENAKTDSVIWCIPLDTRVCNERSREVKRKDLMACVDSSHNNLRLRAVNSTVWMNSLVAGAFLPNMRLTAFEKKLLPERSSLGNVCLAFKSDWPVEAMEWETRTRNYSWPSQNMINRILTTAARVTPASKSSTEMDKNWKYSFENAEKLLSDEALSAEQLDCFHIAKVLVDDAFSEVKLSMRQLRHVFFYVCEETDPMLWTKERSRCLQIFVNRLCGCLSAKLIPNYFIPTLNLLENIDDYQYDVLKSELEVVRQNPFVIMYFTFEHYIQLHRTISTLFDRLVEDSRRYVRDPRQDISLRACFLPLVADGICSFLSKQQYALAFKKCKEAANYFESVSLIQQGSLETVLAEVVYTTTYKLDQWLFAFYVDQMVNTSLLDIVSRNQKTVSLFEYVDKSLAEDLHMPATGILIPCELVNDRNLAETFLGLFDVSKNDLCMSSESLFSVLKHFVNTHLPRILNYNEENTSSRRLKIIRIILSYTKIFDLSVTKKKIENSQAKRLPS